MVRFAIFQRYGGAGMMALFLAFSTGCTDRTAEEPVAESDVVVGTEGVESEPLETAPPDQAREEGGSAFPVVFDEQAIATVRDAIPEHADSFERGKHWFDAVCSACHSVSPPPNLAPPMVMVAGHYLDEYDTRDAAETAVAAWITSPDPERSALPQHAIERFGLMPPQPLPREDAEAVAYYVFELLEQQETDASAPSLGMEEVGGESEMGPGMRGMGPGMRGMEPGSDGAGPGMRGMGQGMHRDGHMHRGHRSGG